MGLFFITNIGNAFSRAKALATRMGFSPNGELATEGYSGVVYDKKAISTDNIVRLGEGKVLANTGTLFTDQGFDVSSNPDLISKYGIIKSRPFLKGHYSLISCDKEELKIVTDKSSSYSVYYTIRGSKFFVSSSLYIISASIKNIEVDYDGLIERFTFIRNVSPFTPFKGIYRLDSSSCFRFLSGTPSIIGLKNKRSYISYSNFDDYVSKYSERLLSALRPLSRSQKNTSIQLTAGLDSRLIFSALNKLGCKPSLIVRSGEHRLAHTEDFDAHISERVSKDFDLSQYVIEHENDSSSITKQDIIDGSKKYGFGCQYQYFSPTLYEEYNGSIKPYPEILILGTAPGFTNSRPWKKFSASGLYQYNFLLRSLSLGDFSHIKNSSSFVSSIFCRLKRRHDVNVVSYMTGQKLIGCKYLLYNWPESQSVNFLSRYTRVYCPLATQSLLHPLVFTPKYFRSGSKLQLEAIKYLSPEVLQYPVMTGTSRVSTSYNSEGKLSINSSRAQGILSKMSHSLPYYLYDNLKKVHSFAKNVNKSDNRTFQKYESLIKDLPIYDRLNTHNMSCKTVSYAAISSVISEYASSY